MWMAYPLPISWSVVLRELAHSKFDVPCMILDFLINLSIHVLDLHDLFTQCFALCVEPEVRIMHLYTLFLRGPESWRYVGR